MVLLLAKLGSLHTKQKPSCQVRRGKRRRRQREKKIHGTILTVNWKKRAAPEEEEQGEGKEAPEGRERDRAKVSFHETRHLRDARGECIQVEKIITRAQEVTRVKSRGACKCIPQVVMIDVTGENFQSHSNMR